MNTLKNILFFGLLLAVLCGVYFSLNRPPEPTLPPGLSGDTMPPKIEMGLEGAPSSPNNVSASPSNIPAFPAQPPPLSMSPPPASGGTAPPYQPPTTTGSASPAPAFSSNNGSPALAAPPGANYPPGVTDPFDTRSARAAPPSASSPSSLPEPPADHSSSTSLDLVMQQVKLKVSENRFADALLILSQLYGSPDLPPSQSREVTQILDQMAAKVIYSREHWLESPYLVQAGDTLDTISDRYQIPALLLARINSIRNPQNLPPGKELKVLKGPFSAQISTDRSEMTLMLADRYAGRFSVVLNSELSRATGIWKVREKGPSASVAGGESGKQWIELGNASGNIGIQGTNDTRIANGRGSRTTIWLSEQDMDDVFGILSVGSSVIIQR